jgi:hypothetical protein
MDDHEREERSTEKPSSDDHPIISSPPHPRKQQTSYLSSLRPFNGRYTPDPYLHLLLRPFPLFLHPGVLWSCLIQGTLIGFTVLIGIVLAAINLGPPLWFGEVETGYMYTGAFVGALLGFLLTGLISDPSANLLTKWNNGVYEPEFRMVMVVPQVVFGGAGIIGFGWTSADTARYGWFWPDFFFGMVVIGMVCGAVGSALYIVDAHREFFSLFSFFVSLGRVGALKKKKRERGYAGLMTLLIHITGDMSIETFTCLLVFKNIFSFALTFKGFDWIVKAGSIKDVFVAVGCVQIAVCALTVPMCKYSFRNSPLTAFSRERKRDSVYVRDIKNIPQY